MPHLFFLYEQKSDVHHSISLKISTNKLQERIQSDFHHITRPYPIVKILILNFVKNV
jgi:hypothetical protein